MQAKRKFQEAMTAKEAVEADNAELRDKYSQKSMQELFPFNGQRESFCFILRCNLSAESYFTAIFEM